MILCNVSDAVVIVANNTKYYATLRPRDESPPLPDELLQDELINSMIKSGHLVVLQPGQKPPKGKAQVSKKAQTGFSLIKDQEVRNSSSKEPVISAVRGGSDDASPEIPQIPGITEADGSLLIRQGSKSKPAKIINVSPREIEKQSGSSKTKIIKTSTNIKELNLDVGDMGGMIVNESGIPGQGKVKNIKDLTDDDLAKIRARTTAIMEQAKQDKKLLALAGNWRTMDNEKKLSFINHEGVTVDALSLMLRLEDSPAMQLKIKGRTKKLKKAAKPDAPK